MVVVNVVVVVVVVVEVVVVVVIVVLVVEVVVVEVVVVVVFVVVVVVVVGEIVVVMGPSSNGPFPKLMAEDEAAQSQTKEEVCIGSKELEDAKLGRQVCLKQTTRSNSMF